MTTVAVRRIVGVEGANMAHDYQSRRSRWGRDDDTSGMVVLDEGEIVWERKLLLE